MRRIAFTLAVAAIGAAASIAHTFAQTATPEGADAQFSIPPGYREWKLISVAREEGKLDDIRAVLGNDLAFKTASAGTLPYPDGAVIARIAWRYDPLKEGEEVFGGPQAYVAGPPKNGVQFMVKDSRKYAGTGGWGYFQFDDGKTVTGPAAGTCFACHAKIEARDQVFARYAQ